MNDVFAPTAAIALPPGTPWESGVIPLAGGVESDPNARLAAILIVAGGFVLHGDVASHPPAEIAGIATLLASAVRDVIARGTAPPPAIRVRHADVAAALAPLLADLGIAVRHLPELPMLDDVATKLVQSMGGFDAPMPLVSMPHSWAAWGLPATTIADLFTAAAAFHEATPWAHLTNDQTLRLDLANGASWTASVLGNGGEQFGLALYEDPEDLFLMFTAPGANEAFMAMRSPVLSLTFDARADLPKTMRREVAKSGWTVAGSRAYPLLWTLNTPGGGITSEQMLELTNSLYAVARFAVAQKDRLADPASGKLVFDWRDVESGTVVHHQGRPQGEQPSPWQLPVSLTPALPQGPNASARAALDRVDDIDAITAREQRVVDRFETWLRESRAPVTRLSRDVDSVRLFVDAMTQYQGVPLAAVTEYDLRVFMYDWFPRKVASSRTHAMTMRGSLRRFFDFLADQEGITYPWAKPILQDKASYEERWDSFPGGFFWDEQVQVWQGELYADLDERAMLPVRGLADIGEWGGSMGADEAQLHARLEREWLIWRDELIRSGTTNVSAVRAELVLRQHEWERRPRPESGGRSAGEIVELERSKRPKSTTRE